MTILKKLHFSSGTIVVFDRGLVDYKLFGEWTEEGVYFVTRLKDNADYRVVKRLSVAKNRAILKDEIIRLRAFYAQKDCPHLLRRIEVFFKILKQNLRIKTFVGTTANALKIQIWTGLIALLLLKYLKVRSRYNWCLSNLVALLRLNLFSYRDLWEWIDRPIEPPPVIQEAEQLVLSLV